MKSIIGTLFALIISLNSFASEDLRAHAHYAKWQFLFPNEQGFIEIEIKLDPNTDNAVSVSANFDGSVVHMDSSNLALLKDVELSTMTPIETLYCPLPDDPIPDGPIFLTPEEEEKLMSSPSECLKLSFRMGWKNTEYHTENKVPYSGYPLVHIRFHQGHPIRAEVSRH